MIYELNARPDLVPPDAPQPPYRVHDGFVKDRYDRKVRFNGPQLVSANMLAYSQPKFEQAHIDRIRSLGFRFVYSSSWIGTIEDEETGYLDQDKLALYFPYMDMAASAGLQWIYRFRVSHGPTGDEARWDGWWDAKDMLSPEGIDRFNRYVNWAIPILESEYGDMIPAYHVWQWPFHRCPLNTGELDYLYSTTLPEILRNARTLTSKPLIVSPYMSQPENFEQLPHYDFDDNLIYSFAFYLPQHHSNQNPTPWEGNQAEIDHQWEWLRYVIRMKEENNVPLNVVEFGGRRESISSIDKLRTKLDILEYLDAGYCLWSWGCQYQNDDPEFVNFNSYYRNWVPKHRYMELMKAYSNWRVK